jgi:hypothetical protein
VRSVGIEKEDCDTAVLGINILLTSRRFKPLRQNPVSVIVIMFALAGFISPCFMHQSQ